MRVRRKAETVEAKSCLICEESSDGAHFGVEACRACAAFFRRSVALSRVYKCRQDNHCPINANVRCMCRACRYQKCLDVGMQKSAVQRFRDAHGQRNMRYVEEGGMVELAAVPPEDAKVAMPTLLRMQAAYGQLNSVRSVVHTPIDENTPLRFEHTRFVHKNAKAMNYKDLNKVHAKEMNIVADFIMSCFPEFKILETEQKKLMYHHFYLPFTILESCYLTYLSGQTDVMMLPNGHFIDCVHPETYYYDEDGEQSMTPDEAVRMFASSFEVYHRNLTRPLIALQIDEMELMLIYALVFWTPGITGQTSETEEVAHRVRQKLLGETINHYRTVGRQDEAMRLSQITLLLPGIQTCVRRFQEDVEISNVFNAYAVENSVYEIVNGRF